GRGLRVHPLRLLSGGDGDALLGAEEAHPAARGERRLPRQPPAPLRRALPVALLEPRRVPPAAGRGLQRVPAGPRGCDRRDPESPQAAARGPRGGRGADPEGVRPRAQERGPPRGEGKDAVSSTRSDLKNGLLFTSPWLLGGAVFLAYPLLAAL